MNYLNRFFLYLLALGYGTGGNITKSNSSITNYVDALDVVFKNEGYTSAADFLKNYKSLTQLKKAVKKINSEYSDKANPKYLQLPQTNDHRTLKGLNHFAEFIELCNK